MGNAPSSRNEVVIDVKTSLDVVTNIIQTNSLSISQTGTNKNDFTLVSGPDSNIKTKTLTIGQTIDAGMQASGTIDASVLNKMSADLKSTLDAAVDQASTASSGIFAIADKPSTVNITRAKNALSVGVDTTLKQSTYNEIVQSTVQLNTATITLNGNWTIEEGIIVDQNLVSRIIAKLVITSVIDNANQYLLDNNSNLNITQKADSKSGLFAGGAGMLGSIISSSLLCCICLIILIILFKVKGGDGKSK
jgi:hypothetical protein